MRKLKFALVGCGRIASKHIEAIMRADHAELVAICDINQEKHAKVSNTTNVPFYVDYNEMLRNEDVDVVCVLTPSGLHAQHTIDIVNKYKKHILVEKPMALRLEDADEMIRVCEENQVRLFVVKQNRYNLPVQQLRKAVEAGRFGKMVLGTVRVRWARDEKYYNQDAWRGTWALDGGVLTNQASHHLDLLEWMMGDVEEVYAKTATQLVEIETEDTAVVVLKFTSGALGVIEATTATRPKDIEGSISILGEDGSVEIGGFAVNEMKIWQFASESEEDVKTRETMKENPPNVYGFGHNRLIAEVCDAILNNKQFMIDGKEGRKVIALLHAIYRSVETGASVRMKDDLTSEKLGVQRSRIDA